MITPYHMLIFHDISIQLKSLYSYYQYMNDHIINNQVLLMLNNINSNYLSLLFYRIHSKIS